MVAMSKESFLRGLLDRMSIPEKAGQLNLLAGSMDITGSTDSGNLEERVREGLCGAVFNVFTPEATRELQELALQSPHRIPLIFGYDVIHGHRTIFPIPLAMSCSWNPGLLERCARAAAAESAADGLHWVFSPMVDISQDARWGRVAEGSGEDPWLGAILATAMVRGYQGNNLADTGSVLACVKHFALYGASLAGRDYHAVDMSRREMEETYFPPYRAAVDAGAVTIMTSFNVVDGIPATSNSWLITTLLRHEWGFRGWVVTDHTAVGELKNHGTAETDADAARQSFTAGVDMDMVSEAFLLELPAMIEAGTIPEQALDTAVMRILETKWDLGLFEDAYARCDVERAERTHLCAGHRELAREAARESIVLLKNDTSILPLAKDQTIALIGPFGDSRRDMLGCWIAAGDESTAVSPLLGLHDALSEHGKVLFAPGCEVHAENDDLLEEAIRTANHADTIILILGERWDMYGEATSRTDIRLPKAQRRLARRIARIGKPCVLITLSGRPLDLSKESGRFPTLLHAWALGTEAGHALSDVIFGDHAPVGKLTMGFPRNVGQLPMTYREKPTGRPRVEEEKYTSKYIDSPNDALFPFGHGLTYGALELVSLHITSPDMKPGGDITISATLGNTGKAPVTETLQLYIRDKVASVSRPVKELRGYLRVTLAAGETREVSFTITDAELSFPGPDLTPVVEPGGFEAMVGFSSQTLRSISFTRQ